MTRDPKLRLIRGGAPVEGPDGGAEPPFDEEELALAEQTRDAMGGEGDPFVEALRAAYGSERRAPIDHEALLAKALGAPLATSSDAAATSDEQVAADALRRGLEAKTPSDDEGDATLRVASILAAAHRPRPIAPLRNELLIARALARKPKPLATRVLPWIGAAVALAASVALGVRTGAWSASPSERATASVSAPEALIEARSTATLFDPMEPFPPSGGTSERVDRIAAARAADLRQNRFARWGVR